MYKTHKHINWETNDIFKVCWKKDDDYIIFAITKLWTPDSKKIGKITWENLEGLTKSKIYRTFRNTSSIYLNTNWGNHLPDTYFGYMDPSGDVYSEKDLDITQGLLKTLRRIYIDEPKLAKKSQSIEQFKCQEKYAPGGERKGGEERDYIAWRFRVI